VGVSSPKEENNQTYKEKYCCPEDSTHDASDRTTREATGGIIRGSGCGNLGGVRSSYRHRRTGACGRIGRRLLGGFSGSGGRGVVRGSGIRGGVCGCLLVSAKKRKGGLDGGLGSTTELGTEGLSSSEIRGSAVAHQTIGDGGLSSDAEAGKIAGESRTDLSNAADDTRVGCLSTHEGGNGSDSRQTEVLHDF
jgi:hypothetical protein